MKKIYIICPVTIANDEDRSELAAYVAYLEDSGFDVYYPARDTDQSLSGFDICLENGAAIQEADEVHVFYRSESKGSHFDLGIAFAFDILYLGKKGFKLVICIICIIHGESQCIENWLMKRSDKEA